jgi:hypothetical protein
VIDSSLKPAPSRIKFCESGLRARSMALVAVHMRPCEKRAFSGLKTAGTVPARSRCPRTSLVPAAA